jgi:hypothetical protein
MWARRSVEGAYPSPSETREADALGGVIRGLLVPAAIAAIRYARGCRIRRVKVKAGGSRRKVPNAPVIILSKRLLDEVRPPRASAPRPPASRGGVRAA